MADPTSSVGTSHQTSILIPNYKRGGHLFRQELQRLEVHHREEMEKLRHHHWKEYHDLHTCQQTQLASARSILFQHSVQTEVEAEWLRDRLALMLLPTKPMDRHASIAAPRHCADHLRPISELEEQAARMSHLKGEVTRLLHDLTREQQISKQWESEAKAANIEVNRCVRDMEILQVAQGSMQAALDSVREMTLENEILKSENLRIRQEQNSTTISLGQKEAMHIVQRDEEAKSHQQQLLVLQRQVEESNKRLTDPGSEKADILQSTQDAKTHREMLLSLRNQREESSQRVSEAERKMEKAISARDRNSALFAGLKAQSSQVRLRLDNAYRDIVWLVLALLSHTGISLDDLDDVKVVFSAAGIPSSLVKRLSTNPFLDAYIQNQNWDTFTRHIVVTI